MELKHIYKWVKLPSHRFYSFNNGAREKPSTYLESVWKVLHAQSWKFLESSLFPALIVVSRITLSPKNSQFQLRWGHVPLHKKCFSHRFLSAVVPPAFSDLSCKIIYVSARASCVTNYRQGRWSSIKLILSQKFNHGPTMLWYQGQASSGLIVKIYFNVDPRIS